MLPVVNFYNSTWGCENRNAMCECGQQAAVHTVKPDINL